MPICITQPQWFKGYMIRTVRHTKHTIVSWLNPKQWLMIHTNDLCFNLIVILYRILYMYLLDCRSNFVSVIFWTCCKITTNDRTILHRWHPVLVVITHWDGVVHICISKLTIIGSDNGLSSGWHQAIIWTNVGILLIETLGTNFNEILSEINTFSSKKIHLDMLNGGHFVSTSMC